MNHLDDSLAVEEILRLRAAQRGFEVRDLHEDHGSIDMEIAGHASAARLRIAGPSSRKRQYWLYADPQDERDWAEQLMTWIQEEVATGGLTSSRVRVVSEGQSYVEVVPYGWRLADQAEHLRLQAAVPATGWYEPER